MNEYRNVTERIWVKISRGTNKSNANAFIHYCLPNKEDIISSKINSKQAQSHNKEKL